MSVFKDIVKRDVLTTFLNLDEFGEKHSIDGNNLVLVFDDVELVKREQGRVITQDYVDGIYKDRKMFYVNADDLETKPRIGRILLIDNRAYRVTDVTEESGILTITVEVNSH
jgi:hypothetical protein